jgi:hypothetical protein
MEKKKKKFNITDKRKFDEKGNLKKEFLENKQTATSERKENKTEKKSATAQTGQKKSENTFQQKAPIPQDFSTFILSLSTNAYIYLGILEDPLRKEKKVNLEAAIHVIDIIAMLKEKTKGNLAPNEEQLLDSILYELRMQYLKKSNAIKTDEE